MDFSFFKNLFSGAPSQEDMPEEEKDILEAPQEDDDDVSDDAGLSYDQPEDTPAAGVHKKKRRRHGRKHRTTLNPTGNIPESGDEETQKIMKNLVGFVEFAAKSLVEQPDKVAVSVEFIDRIYVIMISCEKSDTGKLIGRSGRIISSIRTLVAANAGRIGLKVTVDIKE